jgi:hypothetical protein
VLKREPCGHVFRGVRRVDRSHCRGTARPCKASWYCYRRHQRKLERCDDHQHCRSNCDTGRQVAGQATVKSDCTGSITYNSSTLNPVNITFVVNLKTEEIFGLVTDKGSVISCVLKRMTNGRGAPDK